MNVNTLPVLFSEDKAITLLEISYNEAEDFAVDWVLESEMGTREG